jgi:hypothetical protein
VPNQEQPALEPASLRFLTAPFVAQLAKRAGAVFASHPTTGAREWQERLLPSSGTVLADGYQRRHGAPMPRNDRGLASFGSLEKIRKLIARFFRALAQKGRPTIPACSPHPSTARYWSRPRA